MDAAYIRVFAQIYDILQYKVRCIFLMHYLQIFSYDINKQIDSHVVP